MRKWFKCFAVLLSLSIVFSSVQPPITVTAVGSTGRSVAADFPQTEEAYNAIMSEAKGGAYFITCQPASAIRLSDVVTLTADMLSPNYTKGVVDLPRLGSSYYYAFGGSQTSFYLGQTVYPTLCWTDASKGTSATLCIYERNTNSVVYSCTIVNPDLDGLNMADMVDASTDLVTGLVNDGGDVRKYSEKLTIYNPDMHKSCIVMPNYVYTPNVSIDTLTGKSFDNTSVEESAYKFKRLVMTPSGVTSKYNIKDYLEYYSRAYRSAVLFAGSKFDDCYFDGNIGEAVTKVTSSDVDPLYFFIATQDKCYFSVVTLSSIPNEDVLTQADASKPKQTWISSEQNSVLYHPDDNPDFPDFGPVSYDEWFSYAAKAYHIDLMSGKYGFTYRSNSTIENANLYAYTLMYAGVEPNVITLDLKKQPKQVQLEYMVMEPGDTKYKLKSTETRDADTFDFSTLLTLDSKENYTPTEWCIDPECTKPFATNVTIDPTANSKYTLYSTYKWSGGKYSVVFYNDVTNTQSEVSFNLDEKPRLPEIPDPQPGYGFRNWYIVDSTSATDGIPYDANSFTPEQDTKYLFKTMWDIKGIITQVLTSKLTYYIGDKVDKNLLEVYVQYNNEGDTRILGVDEFELEQETIDKAGVNQFWVVYPETHARGMCEITGLTVAPSSLDVTYLGGDTTVGTSLKQSAFNVTLLYNNGSTEKIDQFTINPTTVQTIGMNNITISYGDVSTTVQIKGISVDNPTGAEVRSLSASYIGNKPKVNQKINAKDLLVVAEYADGTNKTLSSSQFQFTPDQFTTAGSQRITVVFGGKNTTCDVQVEKVNAPNSSNNNNNNNNSSTKKPTTTSGGSKGSTTTTPRPNTSTNKNNNTSNNTNTNSNQNKPNNNTNTNSNNNSNENDFDLSSLFSEAAAVTPKDGKGTSIGYINGSNILTNVMSSGADEATVNDVDILTMIEEIGDNATSLTITLVNGASGNDITPEMLQLLQSKTISLYINMVSPVNKDVIVGRWIIVGGQLDNTEVTLNPNINYEVIDKPSDRLLAISLNNVTYPKGCTLTAYPAIETFASGQLIRLYSCSVNRDESKMIKTFPWQDMSNALDLNVYESIYYCLSDAMEAYADGSDLNVDLNEVSLADPEAEMQEVPTPEEPEVGDDFWDEPAEPTPTKRTLPPWMFIVLGIAGLLLLLLIIIMVLVATKRKGGSKKKRGNAEFAEDLDSEDSDFSELEDYVDDGAQNEVEFDPDIDAPEDVE